MYDNVYKYLTKEIYDKYGIIINDNYDEPLLKNRSIFKASDIVAILCNACEHYKIPFESLDTYVEAVTINGLCNYIIKTLKLVNDGEYCFYR